jgi:hypothetical protein
MSSCECSRSVVADGGMEMMEIGDGSNIVPLCFYAEITAITSLLLNTCGLGQYPRQWKK